MRLAGGLCPEQFRQTLLRPIYSNIWGHGERAREEKGSEWKVERIYKSMDLHPPPQWE